jgi:putative endonuclease
VPAPPRPPPVAWTYVVRCVDGSLYTGFARDVVARVAVHNAGGGARYTRGRRPVRLLWAWRTTPERARRLEGLLKHLSRQTRARIVDGDVAALLPVLTEVARRVRRRV